MGLLNLISALIGVLTLAACLLYGWQIEASHRALRAERVAQTERRAGQIASVTGEQIGAIVRSADFALLQLREAYTDERTHFDATAHSILRTFPQGSLIHVAMIGADGYIAYSSLGLPRERIYAGDREHFKVHLSGKDQLEVSTPVFGRASRAWTFLFTRPIHVRGKFRGVAVVSMSPAYISAELARLEMSPNDVIALIHGDGSYLGHNLNWQQAMGKSVAKDRPYLRPDSPARGVIHAPGSIDAAPRIIAWQRLSAANLIVGVGIDERAVVASLEDVQRQSRFSGLAVIVVMAIFGGGISVLLLQVARQQRRLDESETKYRQLYETMTDAYLMVDMDGRILDSNRAFQQMLGYAPEELARLSSADLTPEHWREADSRILDEQVLRRGSSDIYEKSFRRKGGAEFPVEMRSYLLRDGDGLPSGMWAIVRDITERKLAEDRVRASLREKEVLLKEIYHRVKNNLQVVASLLNMQGRGVSDAATKRLLQESANRVKSMALVHEQLYQSKDLSKVRFSEYVRQLVEHLMEANRPLSRTVAVRAEVAEIDMGVETAIPCGLILNELISNAYKHGYDGQAKGEIALKVEVREDGRLRLTVADDGRGLPEGFDAHRTHSLGMQLVATLTQQIEGELRYGSERGAWFEIVFRAEAREAHRLVA